MNTGKEERIRLIMNLSKSEADMMDEIRTAYGLSRTAQVRMLLVRHLADEFPIERVDGGLFAKPRVTA